MFENRPLQGKRFLTFVENEYEELELWYPVMRLTEAGAKVMIAGPRAKQLYEGKHGYPCYSQGAILDMRAVDFQGIICPGGFAADKLRRDPQVLSLIGQIAESKKLVAAICHGPWMLISAGVCRGLRMTGSLGIKDDLINAGAHWEDATVVIDHNIVTSRRPDDLPDFCRGIFHVLAQAIAPAK